MSGDIIASESVLLAKIGCRKSEATKNAFRFDIVRSPGNVGLLGRDEVTILTIFGVGKRHLMLSTEIHSRFSFILILGFD